MTDPYQTPGSGFTQPEVNTDLDSELASRGSRFLAVLVDTIIGVIASIPFWLATGFWDYAARGESPPVTYIIGGTVYGYICFALIHYYFLNKNGQTIGKKLLNIRIVGLDGELQGAAPLLLKRYLPIAILPHIPILGPFLPIIDTLFIFGKNRRCVHDLIADTKVVKWQT